jgi:precorrin-2 dehydrogenase/sirohydrochlorin ferrochelatase
VAGQANKPEHIVDREVSGSAQATNPPFIPSYFPICLDVTNRTSVVVGGGDVAERKVSLLLEVDARVLIISPELTPALRRWRDEGRLEHLARSYRDGDLTAAFLVVAATNDEAVNHAVAAEARQRGVLVNVVDDPAYCDFILPAVLRLGDLTVTVSTGGRSPAIARLVRDELAEFLTAEHATLLDIAAEVRKALRERGQRPSPEAWRRALDGDLLALVRRGNLALVRAELAARLSENGTALHAGQ